MHNFEAMENSQVLKKIFFILSTKLSDWLTLFHRELNPVEVDQQVKSKRIVNQRTTTKHTTDFGDTVFLNDFCNEVFLPLSANEGNVIRLYGNLFSLEIESINFSKTSFLS